MEKEKKKNFNEILATLRQADEGYDDLTDDNYADIIGDVQGKIDSLKEVLTRCEAEAERLSSIIKEVSEKKKSVENTAQRIKNWVLFCMQKNNMPVLHGNMYSVAIKKNPPCLIPHAVANDNLFVKYAMKYPNIFKRSIDWNKTEAKKALQENPTELKDLFELVETVSIKFTIKKGL